MDIWRLTGLVIIVFFICFGALLIIAIIGPSNIVDVYTGRNIAVSYETFTISQYGEGQWVTEPDPGYVFLRVDITIKNNGYEEFYPGASNFYLSVDNIKYSYCTRAAVSSFNWIPITLLDGGQWSGTLVFEIPPEASSIVLFYDGIQDCKINWEHPT